MHEKERVVGGFRFRHASDAARAQQGAKQESHLGVVIYN
jgi:hypothetical protein